VISVLLSIVFITIICFQYNYINNNNYYINSDNNINHNRLLKNDNDHPSLFQAVSHLNQQIGSVSIIIIVGFVFILRKTFDTLHYHTYDTSFRPMLTLIEEELMIVGVSSFTLKILSNTYIDFTDSTWYYPLEFGELLIPILAFSYCMMGIILIITSLSQVYRWNRAHHMRVVEILDDYFQLSGTIMFR
jgi:hypothetical protein